MRGFKPIRFIYHCLHTSKQSALWRLAAPSPRRRQRPQSLAGGGRLSDPAGEVRILAMGSKDGAHNKDTDVEVARRCFGLTTVLHGKVVLRVSVMRSLGSS